MMRFTVFAHQSGAVYCKHHMELHQPHIVKQHIESALQKTGINGKHRHHALGRHTGRHSHRMPLGDAHIKKRSG